MTEIVNKKTTQKKNKLLVTQMFINTHTQSHIDRVHF